MENRRAAISALNFLQVVLCSVLAIILLLIIAYVLGIRVKVGFPGPRSRSAVSVISDNKVLIGDYHFKKMKKGKDVVNVGGIISFSKNGNYFFSIKERIDDQLLPASSGNGTYMITGGELVLKPAVSLLSSGRKVAPDTLKFKFSFDGRDKLNIVGFSIKDFAVIQEVEYVLVRKTEGDSGGHDDEKQDQMDENNDSLVPEIPDKQVNPDRKEI